MLARNARWAFTSGWVSGSGVVDTSKDIDPCAETRSARRALKLRVAWRQIGIRFFRFSVGWRTDVPSSHFRMLGQPWGWPRGSAAGRNRRRKRTPPGAALRPTRAPRSQSVGSKFSRQQLTRARPFVHRPFVVRFARLARAPDRACSENRWRWAKSLRRA
jgi:hypothetical protein